MTLDDLALQYKTGWILEVSVHGSDDHCYVKVVGFDYTLPLTVGGLPEPAIVVKTAEDELGHVYPHEVVGIVS